MIDGRLLMVGCGNMGGAMLHRWLECGLNPKQVVVVSPSRRVMPTGISVVTEIPYEDDEEGFEVIVLAHKPHQLADIRRNSHLDAHAPRLLMSILAGVDLASLKQVCDAETVVRALPNLPVAIGQGVTLLHGDAAARAVSDALATPLGLAEWIDDEALFDAATALSGSGPGFLFRYIDALAAAGAAIGLPADQSARLALATVTGSAMQAGNADVSPGELARRVASKGGSTQAGYDVLDRDGALIDLLTRVLAAAERRNAEMGADARATSG